jgi:hypothetical protein
MMILVLRDDSGGALISASPGSSARDHVVFLCVEADGRYAGTQITCFSGFRFYPFYDFLSVNFLFGFLDVCFFVTVR